MEGIRKNDPTRFPHFLAKTNSGELTSQDKRLYILFTCCKLGCRHGAVDSLLVQVASKVICDSGVGLEEGVVDPDVTDNADEASEIVTSSTGSRKRRSYSLRNDEAEAERKAITGAIRDIAGSQKRKMDEKEERADEEMELLGKKRKASRNGEKGAGYGTRCATGW